MTEPTQAQIATAEAIGQLAADLSNVLMKFHKADLDWEQAAFATGLALKGLGELVHQVDKLEHPEIYTAITHQVMRALALPREAVVVLKSKPGEDNQAVVIPASRPH